MNKNLKQAVLYAWDYLLNHGVLYHAKNWQGRKAPAPMLEVLHINFQADMPDTIEEAELLLKPNLPWANDHFLERVGGQPLNPPPSHLIWPFNQLGNKEFIKDEVFDHTYPERFWPRFAGNYDEDFPEAAVPKKGIRFYYGDLSTLIMKLSLDPGTRQAYLPIWFPEDTGQGEDIRVPCTLGYHFIIRDNKLHITYFMRSVDMIRHFQDDLYLCYRLAHYLLHQIHEEGVSLGTMYFHGINCHIFKDDVAALAYKIKKWKSRD